MRPLIGVLLVALCATPGATAAAQDGNRALTPEHGTRVVADALQLLERGEAGAHARARERLVQLGPGASSALFAFVTGRVSNEVALASERSGRPLLDENGRELILDVLRSWPAAEVAGALVRSLPPGPPYDDRWVAIRLLGEIGDARALPGLFAILEPVPRAHFSRPFVSEMLEGSLATILERDPDSNRTLRELVESLDEAILPSLVDALAQEHGPASVFLMLDLLGRSSSLDESILQAIGQPDPRHQDALFGPCVDSLRSHLEASEPRLVRSAAYGLGRWRDEHSLETLVELLDGADAGFVRVLRLSLQEITGLSVQQSSGAWRTWLSAQALWYEERMPLELAELDSGEPARVIGALRRLSERRIYHREIAPRIAILLHDENLTTATSTCATLERLGDPSVLPHLIELLGHSEPALRSAAHRALLGIGGVELPPEADAWTEWLEGSPDADDAVRERSEPR